MQYYFQPTSTTLILDNIDDSIAGYCCGKRKEDNWWSGGEDDEEATTDCCLAVTARIALNLWAHLIELYLFYKIYQLAKRNGNNN